MVRNSRPLLLVATLLLGGCATIPAAPSVMALPGPAKTLEQFHADDTLCRQWAVQQAQETAKGATSGQLYGSALQQWYDMAYLQCMYAKGNRVPGVMSAPLPPPPFPPTAPAPPGPPPPASAEPMPPAKAP
jgi:hypothetical protein